MGRDARGQAGDGVTQPEIRAHARGTVTRPAMPEPETGEESDEVPPWGLFQPDEFEWNDEGSGGYVNG